jgi:hypothetical protein
MADEAEAIASNARVRSYFQRDPIEFVDDIVMAMSHYVNNGIESLASVMTDLHLSENHKRAFIRELKSRVVLSLDRNSDIFEMYVMRNIFHIPVDADLVGMMAPEPEGDPGDLNQSFHATDESDKLDRELIAITREIQDAQARQRELAASIRATETQLKVCELVLARLPDVVELAEAADKLPTKRIDQLIQAMEAMLEAARAAEARAPAQSLAFHQAAFKFD